MSDELKPCPFCKVEMLNAPHHDFKHPVDFMTDNEREICPLNGLKFGHDQRITWNTRHTPEAVKGVVEALEEFIAHEVEYMSLNKLGAPEKQDRVIKARAALKAYKIHIGE